MPHPNSSTNGVAKVTPVDIKVASETHQNGVDAKPAKGDRVVRKKSSTAGNLMFTSFLAAYSALMVASFQGRIPYQKWETASLSELHTWAEWMVHHSYIPVVLSVVYIILTFGTQAYLKNRKGFDQELRMPLAIWSLILAVFSIAGSLRTVPMVYKILTEKGVQHLICEDTRYEWLADNPGGYWTLLFCLSKVPELVDTAFIILRKKELITLHWYHHFTVMLFCWQAWASCNLSGLIFAAMNLSVHAVMYTFYALTALGYRPTTFALFITLGQISQMVVGTAVTTYVVLDKLVWNPLKKLDFTLTIPGNFLAKQSIFDGQCLVSSGNALAGLVMYGSYLLLFVHFFVVTYCVKGAKGE